MKQPPSPTTTMDVLADVLAATRVGGAVFGSSRLSAPWGLSFPSGAKATFHVVSRGSCWLRTPDGDGVLPLVQGDVVLLPRGSGHGLSDGPDTPLAPYEELMGEPSDEGGSSCARFEGGGGGAPTSLICGCYRFDHDGPHPVLSLLPEVLHVPGEGDQVPARLRECLGLLESELAEAGPGSQAVVDRLTDVLFVYVVRCWLDSQPEGSAGWLGALRDAQVGRALARIHEQPARRWTVEDLAGAASMSRAAFARRFRSLVGAPPLTYLTRWRMESAGRLLRDTELPLAQVSRQVGYESEFAFNRAFKRARGEAPGRYRVRARSVARAEPVPAAS